MAIGNNTSFSGDLIFLTPRSKDKNGNKTSPHFTVGRIGEDKKITLDAETVTNVSGNLTRAEVKEVTYKTGDRAGETGKQVVLYFTDSAANEGKGETYHLGLNFGIASRGLFNSLASVLDSGDFTGLSLDYYENKAGYDTYFLKQHNKKTSWKFQLDELPPPLEIKHPTTGKLLQRDYTEANAFFEKIINEIGAKLNKGGKPASSENVDATPEEPSEEQLHHGGGPAVSTPAKSAPRPEVVGDEDIPF